MKSRVRGRHQAVRRVTEGGKNRNPRLTSNSTPGPFHHQELGCDSSFRIATLQPGAATDDIEISLFHADFGQKHSYEALSYVWGDPNVTRPISCGGQPFNVTVNLFLALRRLRYEDRSRHLWIDSICINQSSKLERHQQISRMRAVYSHASQVIIWAGEDDTLANGAYHLVGLVIGALRDNPDIVTEDPAQRIVIRNAICSHRFFSEHARSAVAFLGNEWFRRVWTFQEAYLCQDGKVVCGKLTFPWKPFVFSWGLLEELGIKFPLNGLESAKTVIATCAWALEARDSGSQQEENPLRLSNLMRSTNTHKASDDRDRVFGLLAMVLPRNGVRYLPDYNATFEDVYTHYARLMIQDDGHLQILSDAQNMGHDPALPSWVPDWRNTLRASPLAERIRDYEPKYHLHRGFDPQDVITHTKDPRKLKLRGVRVGTVQRFCLLGSLICEVSPKVVQVGTWREAICQFKQFYDNFNFFFLNLPPIYSHTGEPIFSEFVRTLAGDDLPNSNRRSEGDSKHYFPSCHDYQSLTWKESFLPLDFDEEAMGDSPYASVVGAPLQEVLDLLFDKGRPTKWSFPVSSWLSRVKVETIYHHIAHEILRVISENSGGRLIYVTDNGYLGIGPCDARVGDHIFDVLGGDVPFVLRGTENPNEFTLLGDTYLHGIMDGELWRLAPDGNGLESVDGTLNWEEVVLV